MPKGAAPGRLARYRRQYETLIKAMGALGLRPLLPEALRSPIIVTFRAPQDPAYSFPAFYEAMKRRGFLIYPGKMTAAESFRLGCIGALADGVMTACATACADSLREIGVTRGCLPA
ncbi:2-aminoethylphosphonate--pyruvate aminotransferase 1 [Pararhodospirillum photometricum]|uniref:2-aminoethylphosphonate--pyruvate transaminase 1 n=1 Tax=Pararhodospirillum photometricum DSM 122 TaxID=1150469 RepID=H6SPD3_PARPM|nr:2-aminoethylphosphonate--pyruvate aminotransferase 1 [Pararhodospirillum photometricum]CCG09458.1 2-aminoethylphosphonate--pyruvate transaminase 1 [Pararhodospirillum photometricum DSM 122]